MPRSEVRGARARWRGLGGLLDHALAGSWEGSGLLGTLAPSLPGPGPQSPPALDERDLVSAHTRPPPCRVCDSPSPWTVGSALPGPPTQEHGAVTAAVTAAVQEGPGEGQVWWPLLGAGPRAPQLSAWSFVPAQPWAPSDCPAAGWHLSSAGNQRAAPRAPGPRGQALPPPWVTPVHLPGPAPGPAALETTSPREQS